MRVHHAISVMVVLSSGIFPVSAYSSSPLRPEQSGELYEAFREYRCALLESDAPPLGYFSREYLTTYLEMILDRKDNAERAHSNVIWLANLLEFGDKIEIVHGYSEVVRDTGEATLLLSYNSNSGRPSAVYEINYRREQGMWRIDEVRHDVREGAAKKGGLDDDVTHDRFEDSSACSK